MGGIEVNPFCTEHVEVQMQFKRYSPLASH